MVTINHPAIVFSAGVVIGAGIGYLVGDRILRTKYSELSTREIAEAKNFYARMHKKDEFATPEAAVAVLVTPESLDVTEEISSETGAHQKHLTVAASRAMVDYAGRFNSEQEAQDVLEEPEIDDVPDGPYIISVEEFMTGELGYEQVSHTYFEQDDTLVDIHDQPVDNADDLVGDNNLTRFGEKSNDHNIVYVRNDKLGLDIEVSRSKGSYAEEVLGFKPARVPSPKYRGDDE